MNQSIKIFVINLSKWRSGCELSHECRNLKQCERPPPEEEPTHSSHQRGRDSVLSLGCSESTWIDARAVSEPSRVKPQTAPRCLVAECTSVIINVIPRYQRTMTDESRRVPLLHYKPGNKQLTVRCESGSLSSALQVVKSSTNISGVCEL